MLKDCILGDKTSNRSANVDRTPKKFPRAGRIYCSSRLCMSAARKEKYNGAALEENKMASASGYKNTIKCNI